MPANVESAFYVREPAWHKEGTVLDDYPEDWDSARIAAGLTWDPVEMPAYAMDPKVLEEVQMRAEAGLADWGDGQRLIDSIHEEKDFKRIVRNDTGATLAVTSDKYATITNNDMGEIVDALLKPKATKIAVKYNAGGSLAGGKQTWILVEVGDGLILPGDFTLTKNFLAILNRHDGAGACKAVQTDVRVVCANTFSMADAQAEADKTVYSFVHRQSWRDRLEEVAEAIAGAQSAHAAYIEFASELLGFNVTSKQTNEFVQRFMPMPVGDVISDRVVSNIEEARMQLYSCLHSPTTERIAHTAFGLVQAAGEYLDHLRTYRSRDTYTTRTLLKPEPAKAKAVALVREVLASN